MIISLGISAKTCKILFTRFGRQTDLPISSASIALNESLKMVTGFYRAAWNATRSYDEISVCPSVRLFVCPSVRPSVKRVYCDTAEEQCARIVIPYERSFSLVSEKKNGWWGQPLLPEILDQPATVGAKSPILNR